jgi:hypothetical protein
MSGRPDADDLKTKIQAVRDGLCPARPASRTGSAVNARLARCSPKKVTGSRLAPQFLAMREMAARRIRTERREMLRSSVINVVCLLAGPRRADCNE